MNRKIGYLSLLTIACALCTAAHAQSTVGEILEKGGRLLTRDDFLKHLPARIQQQWPNRQGEEELFLSVDGKITGTGKHYASRSESAAEGTWKIEDDGRLCTPKRWVDWNQSTNLCWYGYVLGSDYYGAQKTDADSKVNKVNAFGKAPAGRQ